MRNVLRLGKENDRLSFYTAIQPMTRSVSKGVSSSEPDILRLSVKASLKN